MVSNGAEHYAHLCLRLAGCIVAICHHTGFHGATYHTTTHTVAQALRLFEDFLQHEVRETALLYLAEVDIHGLHLRVELYVLDVYYLQFLTETHHSDVAILQINHLISIFDDRTGIRTEIKLSVLTDTYHQWTLLAGSNNLVRVTLVKNCDGISANHLTERYLNGSQQIKILLHLNVFDELNEHLCISLALELHTLGNQVLLDVGIVLDNTIMNHGKILAGRIMRMSIHS